MKIITKEEGEKWLQDNHLPTEGTELRVFYKNSMIYQYGQNPGEIICLGNFFADYFSRFSEETALWITAWSFGCENMNLFTKFRKGLNEERPIRQAPFHLFEKTEKDDLESLMDLVMFNTWDTYLILPKRGIVFSPNDEFLHVSCKKVVDFKAIKKFLNAYEYRDVTEYWKERMAKIKEKRVL